MPIRMLDEVKTLINARLRELTASLRHTKYAWIKTAEEEAEAKQKKDQDFQARVIRAVCEARMDIPPRAPGMAPGMQQVPFTLRSRLIVNQAGGVLENANLCLDPHYGCPYIPGSAVKGIARHAAWCDWFAEPDPRKKRELAWLIAEAFGFPSGDPKPRENAEAREYLDDFIEREWKDRLPESVIQAGGIVFFPAYPTTKPELVLDVVTCLHRSYYRGERTVATEDEEPQPHFFPAVEKGAEFLFCIAPSTRLRRADEKTRRVVMDFARDGLQKGLAEHGIGAKTAAGYGWFTEHGPVPAVGGTSSAQATTAPATGDYTEKIFANIVKLANDKGQWNTTLRQEMDKLKKPENAQWLAKFKAATSGPDYKDLRKQEWYPK